MGSGLVVFGTLCVMTHNGVMYVNMYAHGDSTGGNHCALHVTIHARMPLSVDFHRISTGGHSCSGPGIPGFHGRSHGPDLRSHGLDLRSQDLKVLDLMISGLDLMIRPLGSLISTPRVTQIDHFWDPFLDPFWGSEQVPWPCATMVADRAPRESFPDPRRL